MIHRALLGSMERFAGILIEHYGGRFPVWLAPVQAMVLPVADRHIDYANRVADELRERRGPGPGRRAHRVGRPEDPRRRAREAARYMLVVGDRELEAAAISVRSHDEGDLGSMHRRRTCSPRFRS